MCKKLLIYVAALFVLMVCGTMAIADTHRGKIGVGVSFERGLFWVDQAKQLRPWQQPGMGASLTSAEIDAQGWPLRDCSTCLMDYRPVAEWAGQIDDPLVYRVDVSGTYKCSFNGKATLTMLEGQTAIANQVYNPSTNTTTFDLIVPPPAAHHGLVVIQFTNTQRTETSPLNTGFTNFKAIVPGYQGSTETFTNEFYNALAMAPFACLRFMGFNYVWSQETNVGEPDYPETIDWSERELPTDATQQVFPALGRYNMAAWEYTIEIANKAGTDCWINVPVSATTNYVTQLATLFKNNLSSSVNIYLESANEVWGSGFRANLWNHAQAQALGLTDLQNHARRTVELAQIFGSVFGSGSLNTRIRPVLCHFIIWPADYTTMLNYINTTYGPPNTLIYAIGGAPYYSGRYNGKVTVDGVIAKFYQRIDENVPKKQALQSVASTWGLKHVCYEGGSDTGGGSTTNIDKYITAERDPRMHDVFMYDLDTHWFPYGGDLFMHLSLSSGYNRYGSWGLLENLAVPNTYKMQAMIDLLGPPGPPGQATNPNPANGATDVSTGTQLSWTAGSGAESHDVYFGTATNPPFIGNQTTTTYNPGGLSASTTYHWRIDEKNESGTTTGVAWSFTTGGGGCIPTDMHVDNIVCGRTNVGAGCYVGWADVTIKNDCGVAVSGATVTAYFDWFKETVSGATNSQGVAHLQTSRCDHNLHGTWTVTNVTGPLPYHPADNLQNSCSF